MINYAPRHKDVWGRGGKAPRINLGTRWGKVISLKPRLLYPRPAVGPTQCVQGVKQSSREADFSSPYSSEAKNVWN